MGVNLDAVRAAIETVKPLALEFQTGEIKLYEDGNTTALLTTTCRVTTARPSAFDAGNQTEWAKKRILVVKVPLTAKTEVIRQGLIAQISTPDGDPKINKVNFTVQSALGSQFAAERDIVLTTEEIVSPRIS